MTFRVACLTALLWAGVALAGEENVKEKAPPPAIGRVSWSVIAECRMVVLRQKDALPLIALFGDEATAEEAWDQVQKMVESGKAALAADLVAAGSNDDKLKSECLEEVRYATEYEPAQVPDRAGQKDGAALLNSWPHIGLTPTAFETRSVGESMQLEVEVTADGAWLDVSCNVEHSRFLRWLDIPAGELPNGRRFGLQQPEFHVMSDTPSFRLPNGGKILVGVHKLDNPDKTLEFFLLRITARKAG